MNVAEAMGRSLQQTSISTNIKERLDYSCALFSHTGDLVANAPFIPVHLGSMSFAVKFQLNRWKADLHEGDVLLANSPIAGGSHLPDLTVITPIFDPNGSGEIIFFTASRAHHSDIGGIIGGSMPATSTVLAEEGAEIVSFKLVHQGKFDAEGLYKLLVEEPAKFPGGSGCRNYRDVESDIKAVCHHTLCAQWPITRWETDNVANRRQPQRLPAAPLARHRVYPAHGARLHVVHSTKRRAGSPHHAGRGGRRCRYHRARGDRLSRRWISHLSQDYDRQGKEKRRVRL